MTSDLLSHLRTAIDARYEVERQLAAGGMSRVFLATEPALGRRVVIKVLPPDLAAEVSIERFRREMQLAARLQHPHIVPLLSAGDADGLLYYSMPFVEGESLRERLQQEGPLSIAETVRVIREVADALGYAHAQGVVHRDIKPENLLISAGHVLVTDFGVAKALSGATCAPGSPASLTTIGVALGTPAYMAPEQAVADPATDHRSDLYALGVVAYELLAGQPPFAGRSPRAVVAAHLTEQPAPLVQHRAGVPEALDSLIMCLLEKDPGDRPQSAVDVVRRLDQIGAGISSGDHRMPGPSPTPPVPASDSARQRASAWLQRYGPRAAAVGAAMVASAALMMWLGRRVVRPRSADDDIVAIVPFRVPASDTALAGLHDGIVDLLHDRFAHSVSPASVLEAWKRETGGRVDADLPLDRKLEIAKRLGASQLVSGSIVRMPRGVELQASLVRVSDGESRTSAAAAGAAEDFGALIDTVANQLLSVGAGEADRLYLLKNIPPSALRLYLDGKESYRGGRYGEAATYFERALDSSRTGDHESMFAFAAFGLVQASNYNRIRNDAPERALRIAWNARARLNARDKALLDAQAGPAYPVLPMRRDQISAWYRAMDSVTDRPEPYFEFADEVLQFRDYVEWPDAADQARTSLEEALRKDSTFVPAIQRLTELAAMTGDLTRAEQLAARLPVGDSATDKSGYVLWRIAAARGDERRLAALRDRFDRMADASLRQIWLSAQLDGISIADATRALDAIGRSAAHAEDRESVDVARYVEALNEGRPREAAVQLRKSINEDPGIVPFVHAELVRDAIFAGGDTAAALDGVERLTRLVRDVAENPAPTADDQAAEYLARCALEEWRLSRGVTDSAALTLQRMARIVPVIKPLRLGGTSTPVLGAEPVCPALIEAWAASLESRTDAGAALERFDRLMARGPPDSDAPTGNLLIARLRVARGDTAGALVALRRRPYSSAGLVYLASSLRDEGRLAETMGDRAGAIRAYTRYLAMRESPEPSLQREVNGVRVALDRLHTLAASGPLQHPARAGRQNDGRDHDDEQALKPRR